MDIVAIQQAAADAKKRYRPRTITPGIPARYNDQGAVLLAANASAVPQSSSVTAIYCIGDSTTEGNQDGSGLSWPLELQRMLDGVTVTNTGIGGRTSTEIATLFGAIIPTCTVSGDTIPTSGAVSVTAITPATTWRSGVAGTYSYIGTLAGIAGTLSRDLLAGTWTFTRTASGAATPCPPGTPFLLTTLPSSSDRNALLISAIGINNYANPDFLDAVRDTDACHRYLTAADPRHIVMSILTDTSMVIGTSGYTRVAPANRQLAAMKGTDYLDHRRWLIDKGLRATGTTAVSGDTTNIQGDTVPPSLFYDNIHPLGTTYRAIARKIGNYLSDKGYVTQIDPINIPGTLVNVEPASPWNPWAAGVPANGALLPNLATHRCLDLGIDADCRLTWVTDATMVDGTHGIQERTSMGGLHGIVSQATPPASNIGSGITVPVAITDYAAANLTHEFMLITWGRITRAFSGSFAYVYSAYAFGASNTLGIGYLGSNSGGGGGTKMWQVNENSNIVGAMFQDIGYVQLATTTTGAAANARSAANWGRYGQGNGTLTNLPSWVLYKAVVIDVTASGKSRQEIHALAYADYKKHVLTSGGRYFGDTFTSPSTLA